MITRQILATLALFTLATLANAQDIRPRVYRDAVRPHWDESGDRFWYRNDLAAGTVEFVLVDAVRGDRGPAFDEARLARSLADALNKQVDPDRLPIELIRFTNDPDTIDLLGTEASWTLNLSTYALTALEASAGADGLPFDRVVRPSARTGGNTHVTFVNRLEETVTLWWIDGSGGRHDYGQLDHGERKRQHTFAGHRWLVTGDGGKIIAVFEAPDEEDLAVIDDREPTPAAPAPEEEPSPSTAAVPAPDGTRAVFIRDHNLWLRDLATGQESQLSYDGAAGNSYRRDGQRPRLVEMDYEALAPADSVPDIVWSPDSRHLLALKTRAVTERRVFMVNSAPDAQLQPTLESYPYLKPGDDLPVGIPHLFDTVQGEERPLDRSLFAHPWSIDHIHWTPEGDRVFFLYNQRGHQVMRVIGVTAATGETKAVVDEACATFFDYQGKTFLHQLDQTDQLIWMSERDGWNHLYLYDRGKGKVRKQLTRGHWIVRGVEKVDEDGIWVRVGGFDPDQDPYYIHHARLDLDGKNFTLLTDGDGTHRLEWSPDRRFFIDQWSRVDLPPVHVLRHATDGHLVVELEVADASEILATGRRFPERFTAPGRDGTTPIHGIIHRPIDWQADGQYPVVEAIYAGPHGQHVPKAFSGSYRLQSLADRGFIVVQIDGMGTNWRSKDFHDVCWQNLVDAGFPDRITWIEAAARHDSSLDLTRVGIYGGSAGGQNALGALLTQGHFYKAAMADCGCHDNRVDKIWWNEQWMGYPVGPQYAASSNVELAGNLEGALLLIVGELDRNVDPASTMQVVDALIEADKDFDLLEMPGVGHGASGTPYGRRRTEEFFVRQLQP